MSDDWKNCKDHSLKAAAGLIKSARTAQAGTFDGGSPPPGPLSQGWKLNGVPTIRETGVSKK